MLLNIFSRKNIKNRTDLELIERIQKKGSNTAIAELYNRYAFMLFGVNLKYLKNKMDAEDVLMLTFEKLADKIKKSEIKHVRNWLYTVCKNECLMRLRKKNTAHLSIDNSLLFTSSNDEETRRVNEKNELKYESLEQAINLLKDNQKKCIELFYLKNNSYDSVATITGLPLKKVKSHIQNGKRKLKLILEQKDAFRQD